MQVIGVVVAGRQGISPDHDAALHFGAEAFGAGAFVQVGQVFGVFTAIAEAYAIETRQVGRGLGRCDHIVRRDSVLHVRQADFLDHGAELFQLLDALVDQLGDAWVQAGTEVLLRQADAQAFERTVERRAVVGHRFIDAGGVLRVETGHALQQQGAVFGGARHRATLVETGGVGDHAPA
ncbi:hypothetical protein D9M71_265570 [compost metagenome]